MQSQEESFLSSFSPTKYIACNEEIKTHICGLFCGEKKKYQSTAEFIVKGLEQNECVLFVEDRRTAMESVFEIIHQSINKNTLQDMIDQGKFIIIGSEKIYGIGKADDIINFFRNLEKDAKKRGFLRLRITAEPYSLVEEKDLEEFVLYERKVNEYFEQSDSIGLCVYTETTFTKKFLMTVLTAHPMALINGEMFDNFYYIPARHIEKQDFETCLYSRWKGNLIHRKQTEKRLIDSKNSAEQAALAKAHFLATMSHEIRTPLNGIIGLADVLSRTVSWNDKSVDSLNIIRASGRHLLRIVNDVLDTSLMEGGKLVFEKQNVVLTDLLKATFQMVWSIAQAKQVKLEWQVEDCIKDVDIVVDETRLNQVLTNLLGNAIKFSHEKGKVKVAVSCSGENEPKPQNSPFFINNQKLNLIFKVIDNGVGIPLDRQEAIFETFTQADNTINRKYGGSGLGLTICRHLCNLWGGWLRVESIPSKLTTFSFLLPTCYATTNSKKLKRPIDNLNPIPKRVSVLVAEDNVINQIVTKKQLELCGCDVIIANNGQEAIRQALSLPFDLILLDLHMPICDGIEAATEIRKHLGKRIPIHCLTASVISEAENNLGLFDSVILKPTTVDSFSPLMQ